MKFFFHKLIGSLFIFLIIINTLFLVEIKKDNGLNNFFYENLELSEDYTEKEKLHMQEVKELVTFSILLSFFLFVILAYLGINKEVLKGFGYSGIMISLILCICLIFFKSFFYYFHIFSFDSTNWLLPGNSKLIHDYPFEYFKNMFILITIIFLFVNIMLINNKKIKRIWDQLLSR